MVQWLAWSVGSVLYLVVTAAGATPTEQTVPVQQIVPVVQQVAGDKPITEVKVITVPEVKKVQVPAPKVVSPTSQVGETKTYVNSKGNTVQSPTYYDTAPAGASAECRDGTYSFSQSRRGTCSHHGGVARWL